MSKIDRLTDTRLARISRAAKMRRDKIRLLAQWCDSTAETVQALERKYLQIAANCDCRENAASVQ